MKTQKCIVEVIYKDGQKQLEQVEFFKNESYTEYRAFDGRNTSILEEIKFIKMV
jgi:hypothetical protein